MDARELAPTHPESDEVAAGATPNADPRHVPNALPDADVSIEVSAPGGPPGAATPSAPPADPLVIRRIDYLGPMASASGWRPDNELPEVAFSGRSNVGKSSLINALVRRKKLARVSNTPGRTREIHFFRINDQFTLVDLPGYGYARISKERKAEWRPLIEGYLRRSTRLAGVVQLLDARHDPTRDDVQMLDFLAELGAPTIVALTKMDKLTRSEGDKRVIALATRLELDEEQLIPFSAVTGRGRDELAGALVDLVAQPGWRETDDEASDVSDAPDAAAPEAKPGDA